MNSMTDTLEEQTNGFSGQFRRVIDPARERAVGAINYGEDVVRRHPETAVFSSLLTGLLIGGVIGWFLADSREMPVQKDLRSLLQQFKGKLNLD
jgi:hypothetical protein